MVKMYSLTLCYGKMCSDIERCVFRASLNEMHFFIIGGFFMFENLGGKLKKMAIALMVLGIIASLVMSILFYTSVFLSIVLFLAGAVLSFLSVLLIYAIGDIVETQEMIIRRHRQLESSLERTSRNQINNNDYIKLEVQKSLGYISEEDYILKLKQLISNM